MKIQILGTGCAKCKALTQQAQQALETLPEASRESLEIEKIEDIDRILSFGVMMTPALAIDDEVVASGKVLDSTQIAELVQGRLQS